MKIKLGEYTLSNNLALAPMAGISNPAYIKLLEEMNLDIAFTELISSEAITRGNKKTFEMLNGFEDIKLPVGIQLFGKDPEVMASAAKILKEKYNVKIIDLNFGCPVAKVCIKDKAGSALLKDPDKIYEIVKRVKDETGLIVTAKIRIGWDESSINAPLVAKKIELAGASLISVHGRTRSQGYSGNVNYDAIKAVKEAVSIPVLGNGDIVSVEDYVKMMKLTGVDGVMIGRGALGNPWIFKNIVDYINSGTYKEITMDEKIDIMIKHINYICLYKNEKTAILELRTTLMYYLKGSNNVKEVRMKINKANSKEELIEILNNYRNNNL